MTSKDPQAIEHFNTAIHRATIINGTLLVLITGICIGAVVLVLLYWFNRHKPDHFTSRIMMKMPIFSSYLRNVSLQDTCKLMTRLLRGKVPLAEALSIIIDGTVEPATRSYWSSCRDRVMAGVDPARALARWPLNKAEYDQITTIQSVDQLAEVYEAIGGERQMMAKADQRRITVLGIVIMMLLFGAVVLTMIYLLMIQNEGFLNSLHSLRSSS